MPEFENKAELQYLTIGKGDTHNITFFYMSDMVDLIMQGIEESFAVKLNQMYSQYEEVPYKTIKLEDWKNILYDRERQLLRLRAQYRKLRIVLGPIEIVNPKNPSESKSISIGDLPISTKYFREWMAKVIEQQETTIFSLASFLNQFIQQFINDTLNLDACFSGRVSQRTKLTQAAITAYKKDVDYLDDISDYIQLNGFAGRYNMNNFPKEDMPLLNTSGERNTPGGRPSRNAEKRETHYIIFFGSRTQPSERQNGIRKEDEDAGVFHYGIGQDSGIVKTINFQRQSAPSLKMLRFEQEGYDGLQQLREQYDVLIKTYANVKAMPGCYIYVEPKSFSPGSDIDLTKLGVGGYLMITKSEHRFAPGIAESTITARWTHGIYDENNASNGTKIEEKSESTPTGKCRLK